MQAIVTLTEAMLIAFLFGWKLAVVLAIAVPFIVAAYYQQSMAVRRHQRRDAELMAKAVRVRSRRRWTSTLLEMLEIYDE